MISYVFYVDYTLQAEKRELAVLFLSIFIARLF